MLALAEWIKAAAGISTEKGEGVNSHPTCPLAPAYVNNILYGVHGFEPRMPAFPSPKEEECTQ